MRQDQDAEHLQQAGVEAKARDPCNAVEKTAQEIEHHFQSHPPTDERIKRLESVKNGAREEGRGRR